MRQYESCFEPSVVLTDFEKAAMNAVSTVVTRFSFARLPFPSGTELVATNPGIGSL